MLSYKEFIKRQGHEKNDLDYNEIDVEKSSIKILDTIMLGFLDFLQSKKNTGGKG